MSVAGSYQVNVPVAKPSTQPQQKASKTQAVSPAISLIAGALGGATEATVTYPFEFAKTRAQLNPGNSVKNVSVSKNPFTVIAQTARQDGVRAIYTGCSTLILGTACKAGVRFLSFDAIKNALADSDGKLSPARAIFAGMVAGAVESVTVVTPTERLKTALIDDARSTPRRFNNGLHALRVIVGERGIGELYRGLLSTTLKQSSTSAVRMGSYNMMKEFALSKTQADLKNPLVTFGLGAVAGIITVYATQPFDTIKTRSQAAKGTTTLGAVTEVWRTGGLKSFWSGSSMRLGRLVLSGGIVFTVYEKVVAVLSAAKN